MAGIDAPTTRLSEEGATMIPNPRDLPGPVPAPAGRDSTAATVSHAMRIPIEVILGMTDIVLDGGLRPTQRRCLEKARWAALDLLAQVEALCASELVRPRPPSGRLRGARQRSATTR
jgi:signal transduction histidine kinase